MTPIDDALLDALEERANAELSKFSNYSWTQMPINAKFLLSFIEEFRRLRKLEADLNHELTDEECDKLCEGLMDVSVHGGEGK